MLRHCQTKINKKNQFTALNSKILQTKISINSTQKSKFSTSATNSTNSTNSTPKRKPRVKKELNITEADLFPLAPLSNSSSVVKGPPKTEKKESEKEMKYPKPASPTPTTTTKRETKKQLDAKAVLQNNPDAVQINPDSVSADIMRAATKKKPNTASADSVSKANYAEKKVTKKMNESDENVNENDDENMDDDEKIIKKNNKKDKVTKVIVELPDPDTKLTKRRSTKVEIDHSVAGGHVNMNNNQHIEKSTRKMTKSDDHEAKVYEKQTDFTPEALSPENLVLMSWNVAGYRGAVKNGLWDKFAGYKRVPDIVCLQEMKIQPNLLAELPKTDYEIPLKKFNFEAIYNLGDKAGYSGVGVWYNSTKIRPLSYKTDSSYAYPPPSKPKPTGFMAQFLSSNSNPAPSDPSHSTSPNPSDPERKTLSQDDVDNVAKITGDKVNAGMRQEVWNCVTEEGRIITVDFGSFYLITTYVPNSGQKLDRLPYRHQIYEPVILEYLLLLQLQKPVMYCGDLNAARDAVDVHTPSTCQKSAGFQQEERERINRIILPTTGSIIG
jgi:exonuclease III